MIADLAQWLPAKREIVALLGFDRDALHIYFSLVIYLATAALFRLRLDDWRAFVPLAAGELVNEFIDLRYEVWPPVDRPMQYWASLHDILNTLAVPLLIAAIVAQVRRFPR